MKKGLVFPKIYVHDAAKSHGVGEAEEKMRPRDGIGQTVASTDWRFSRRERKAIAVDAFLWASQLAHELFSNDISEDETRSVTTRETCAF